MKTFIPIFLSREFKHGEQTNHAWWLGKWYGHGLGNSAMSQLVREFNMKIVEMSLWSLDFLLAHVLLIIMTIPIFIPFTNRLHSTMFCESCIISCPQHCCCHLGYCSLWLENQVWMWALAKIQCLWKQLTAVHKPWIWRCTVVSSSSSTQTSLRWCPTHAKSQRNTTYASCVGTEQVRARSCTSIA